MVVTAPVVKLIVPRELTGQAGGLGHVVGALLALHGVIAVYTVPALNGPVMASTESALESVVYSVPLAEVATALSSTDWESFTTCRFWPLGPEKISCRSPWEFSMKSPANFAELDGMSMCEAGSVSARVTVWPALVPLSAVTLALMAKNGVTVAVLAAAF